MISASVPGTPVFLCARGTPEESDAEGSTVPSGRDDFSDGTPATLWLANFLLSLRDESRRPQTPPPEARPLDSICLNYPRACLFATFCAMLLPSGVS